MEKPKQSSPDISKTNVIWDCGSSLYDSFELKSFEKQLDSAISSRTLSMPHKKPTSKISISRSLQRLIRSVFRPKNSNSTDERSKLEGLYVVYDKSGALTTIPEAPEFDGLSPEIRSLVRRTTSDRFTAATSNIGISCA